MLTIDRRKGRTTRRKTKSSRRNVPIHPILVELGFLEYVEMRRAQLNHQTSRGIEPNHRMFPDLAVFREKTTHYFSKWWGGYAPRHFKLKAKSDPSFMVDERKCFHSLRHSFSDAGRKPSIQFEILQRLLGHSGGGVTARYGRGYGIEELYDAISKIEYRGLKSPAKWEQKDLTQNAVQDR